MFSTLGFLQRRESPAILGCRGDVTLLEEIFDDVEMALGRRQVKGGPAVVVLRLHVEPRQVESFQSTKFSIVGREEEVEDADVFVFLPLPPRIRLLGRVDQIIVMMEIEPANELLRKVFSTEDRKK